MRKNSLYVLVLILLMASCKKSQRLPEPDLTEPHFYMSGELDGQALSIQAGDEDYYMNSSWFRRDSAGLFVYRGTLSRQTGAGYGITILINDYGYTRTSENMYADSALRPGPYRYYDMNPKGMRQIVDFIPLREENPAATYLWYMTDGESETAEHHGYSFSPTLEAGKTYSVTLDYNDGMGICVSRHMNVFTAGSKLQTSIVAEKQSGTDLEYRLSYHTEGTGPYAYACEWLLPDYTIDTRPVLTQAFPPGQSLIRLKLMDKITRDSCISYYQLDATRGTPCDANYSARFSPVYNMFLYSSVTVLLTTPDGRVYSSQDLVQPAESNFEIVSVRDYRVNEAGQPTKQIHLRFNCLVRNGDATLSLKKAEAVIAVAYKK